MVNALLFHIAPSILQRRLVPGIYSAVLLYVPLGIWAIVGASRDGVAPRNIVKASVVGTAIALGVVLAARAVTGLLPLT